MTTIIVSISLAVASLLGLGGTTEIVYEGAYGYRHVLDDTAVEQRPASFRDINEEEVTNMGPQMWAHCP